MASLHEQHQQNHRQRAELRRGDHRGEPVRTDGRQLQLGQCLQGDVVDVAGGRWLVGWPVEGGRIRMDEVTALGGLGERAYVVPSTQVELIHRPLRDLARMMEGTKCPICHGPNDHGDDCRQAGFGQ